jgi:hypothetical protein
MFCEYKCKKCCVTFFSTSHYLGNQIYFEEIKLKEHLVSFNYDDKTFEIYSYKEDMSFIYDVCTKDISIYKKLPLYWFIENIKNLFIRQQRVLIFS